MTIDLFKGWTRADGVRESEAPDSWPFGRRNIPAEQSRERAAATIKLAAARALHLEKQNAGKKSS